MSTTSLFNNPPLVSPTSTPAIETVQVSPSMVPAVVPAPAFSQEDVKRALPSHLRASVTQSLVDTLNGISADPLIAEDIRNNFVSYTIVLQEGKFKADDYIHAVAYVRYKLMGYSNKDRYARAIPQRNA